MISNLEICGLNLELRQTVTGLTIVLRVERGKKKLESLKMQGGPGPLFRDPREGGGKARRA